MSVWLRARRNLLTALPRRLFHAWMAERRTPAFRSFLVNQPDLVRNVLVEAPEQFPKHPAQARALSDLLGNSLFLAEGAEWSRQRRIIDQVLDGPRTVSSLPAMEAAAAAMVERLRARCGKAVEAEAEMSYAAADVILRVLFSQPITEPAAQAIFTDFSAYQRAAPMVRPGAILSLPAWLPRLGQRHRRQCRAAAALRGRLEALTAERAAEIATGEAPDDLATALMTVRDPETGATLDRAEVADQLALMMLAGHETSAAMIAWSLWLLANRPDIQSRLRRDLAGQAGRMPPLMRDLLRETLRLYPPVPFMVRRAARACTFRSRPVRAGSPVILSPWYLGRHERLWHDPHCFDPDRWASQNGRHGLRAAWIPFSQGPRICPGAGFAMQEGGIILAALIRAFEIRPAPGPEVVPLAQLTLRSAAGIPLLLQPLGSA